MDLRKYQDTIKKIPNLKNITNKQSQNESSIYQKNTSKIKVNKLNISQPIKSFKSMNNSINKEKIKNKIHVNIYKKPFKLNGDNNNIRKNIIRENYNKKIVNKNQKLMNISNYLYNTIDLGRNAINKLINMKEEKKIKVKEKTPFKNKININQDNKENLLTNIINNKMKNIYKTKTSNNININKTHNYYNKNNLYTKNSNNLLKSTNISKEKINNISLRLFSKETISSKNKLKKNLLYTPKKKLLNKKNDYTHMRAKTVQFSAKKMVKYLLTSQNSESRFYTNKTLSPKNDKHNNNKEIKSKKKTGSVYSKVNYALNNINNINSITSINTRLNTELTKKNKDKNIININKDINNEIHNFLYHKINSPLSLEIIISESKGIISTKCPLGHITNYNFPEYFSKFRAISDINISLNCFICSKLNNITNISYCLKCSNFLCNKCIYKHEKNLGHKIISMQNINTYCPLHNKKFNSFCFDCNKNCCEMCHIKNNNKNHMFKNFNDILNQNKKEEKSIVFMQNEIRNQLKLLESFIERYNDDIKNNEHSEILKGYFDDYINYFKNVLKLKEKFISKYNYNQNNYYNIMNVLNLSLPLFYDYNKESLFKLARTHFLYDKYLIINDFINFVNNNSFNIFEGNQNYKKINTKLIRTIKPVKSLNLFNDINDINNNKYPKQILDLEYNGYFLLLKDNNFDIYDKDLILVKNFNFINIFGNSYNEAIIGVKLLENKFLAVYNYKRLLIIQFNYDFSSYSIINEFELKINGICNGFNNFGFDDETYEIQNPLINNIIDINKNEIISFGIRYEEKYIGTIWQKDKKQETQILDINSTNKNDLFNIISVLKYNEKKFAILEKNNDIYFNVKIYNYDSPYRENKSQTISKEIENIVNINNNNNNQLIKENIEQKKFNNKLSDKKNKNTNGNNYEKDENISSDESSENIDEIIQEMKTIAEKREEEFKKLDKNQIVINREQEDIIVIKGKIFNEIFNLEKIKCKTNTDDSISSSSLLSLIKINDKLFSFLDNENIIIVNFETCSIVSKINYGSNILIYIDKTPNDNLLFKEKNKIISYHIKNNNLIKIYLPVFEYNNSKGKKISKWFLISGSNDFINKAKIIDNNFMICLFEFRMEKWNLNHNTII